MRLALTIPILVAPVVAAAGSWRDLQRSEPPQPAPPLVLADEVVADAGPAEADGVVSPDAEPAIVAVAELQPDGAAAEPAEVRPVADESPADPAPAPAEPAGPCAEDAEACRDALATLRSDALAAIDIDIRVGGQPGRDYPCECRLEGETFQPRRFATTTFTWKAAGYCHKPLYFEHWNLERYGHSHGFVADSFLSAAHFFGRLPALPYQMGVELPWECVYPLGYYRPGSCAPWTVPAVPVSARGFAVGAATATGIVFLLP